MAIKKRCDKCKEEYQHVKRLNNGMFCYRCWMKEKKDIIKIGFNPRAGCPLINLKDAQKTVRNVHSYERKNGLSSICMVSLPSCYSGRKVKVIVVGENQQ